MTENEDWWPGVRERFDAEKGECRDLHEVVENVTEECTKVYLDTMARELSSSSLEANASAPIKVVYTAMHGVGYPLVSRLMGAFGFREGEQWSAVATCL